MKAIWSKLAWSMLLVCVVAESVNAAELKGGAAVVDVTPQHLPVIRNGGFLQAEDKLILDPLSARCIVLDDGDHRVAMVVVDSCMIPTPLCDTAKRLASDSTGIAVDHIMISATHTHTAPSVMAYCLGSGIDERYAKFLPGKIAQAIQLANDNLQPAKVAWTKIDASHFTKCRRWITRSDKWQRDPFGELTVHANMHPGHQNPDFIGPAGPADPWLSLLMVTDAKEQPLAVLANLSMHYFSGHAGVSADYYGRYARELQARLAANNPQFVGIMSQGTSGDLWWGDYTKPREQKPFQDVDQFASELVDLTMKAVTGLRYHNNVPVRMAEQRLTMNRRTPNPERLAWARRLNQLRGDRLPENRPEVYALQAEHLHQNPTDEVVLQAIRVGDLGVTGIPNEVYGLTGLKLKQRSPLGTTFNISLANGACGYIPPPEQHALGGYNTWAATTAGLEVSAEPKIVNALLTLLEEVADKPRVTYREPPTTFSRHIEQTKPVAYWRLDETEQVDGHDSTGNGHAIRHSGLLAYHLPGRVGGGFGSTHQSHSIQLAGGKLLSGNLELGESYSVQFSFRLGTPVDFRHRTATLFARGSQQLLVTGTGSDTPGRIAFGEFVGTTTLEPQRWYQCVFVRNGDFVQVFLNGQVTPEISRKIGRSTTAIDDADDTFVLGGDRQNTANLEGGLDEVSVYDRALTGEEVDALFGAAGQQRKPKKHQELKSSPLDPNTSLQRIHVRDGFHVELVAAEPFVMDPVAIDWGTDGKLWVAEMADYPMGMDGNGQPGGRIRFLEDTDQDGTYDRSTVFLDSVSFPNGIMAWGNGVLVTAAPEIFFAADTTGDGRADIRETLLSGFMTGNQQLRVNGLRWGLDGLVHCASGAHHAGFGAGNSIFSTKQNASIRVGSRDFRFDPITGFLDPQSGPSQFGRVRDDFGNWFGVQNSQPLWHYVIQDHYVRRNAEIPAIDPRRQIRVPRMPEVYSAKPPQRRFHGFDHAGHYTSACGISIYRDEVLFPREEMHAFTCEPFHNLVQHHTLQPAGSSFRGERADDGPIDFFASTDRWTRPVMTRTGPDGALWVVDMYRYMIEHPQWLPQDGQDALRPGYRAGDKLGRIYRIVPKDRSLRSVPLVEKNTPTQLVRLLEHPNGIVRDQAHRQIAAGLEHSTIDQDVVSLLRKIANTGALAEARVQALASLGNIKQLDAGTIHVALSDTRPSIRQFAVRMAEALPGDELPHSGVLSLVNDRNAKVRLQVAQSLGSMPGESAGKALAKLMLRTDNDAYTHAAICSSLPIHFETVIRSVLEFDDSLFEKLPTPMVDALLVMAETRPSSLTQLLKRVFADTRTRTQQFQTISKWLDGMAERKKTLWTVTNGMEQRQALLRKFNQLQEMARQISLESNKDDNSRAAAVGLLGRDTQQVETDIELLGELLLPAQPRHVQSAAMGRLARIPDANSAETLIQHWQHYLPQQRETAINALLGRTVWSHRLLDAIDAGSIDSKDLGLAQQQRLRRSRDKRVSARANEVFGEVENRNAKQIVDQYATELVVGDAELGRVVFDTNCKICHTLNRKETPVGPDLRTLTTRTRRQLLTAVLDPSQVIEPKYQNYSLVLKSGESISGVVTDEGGSSLTIVDAAGKSRTVSRSSIEIVQRSKKSMMPEGFETKINSAQMSDLLAFLRAL